MCLVLISGWCSPAVLYVVSGTSAPLRQVLASFCFYFRVNIRRFFMRMRRVAPQPLIYVIISHGRSACHMPSPDWYQNSCESFDFQDFPTMIYQDVLESACLDFGRHLLSSRYEEMLSFMAGSAVMSDTC